MADLSEYLELYIEESEVHFKTLRESLDLLEQDGELSKPIRAGHIAAHSLKGISLAMQFKVPSTFAEELETYFRLVLDGRKQVDLEELRTFVERLERAVGEAVA